MKNLRTSSLETFFEVITAFYFKSQQNMDYIPTFDKIRYDL